MGQHDHYGKQLLRHVAGSAFEDFGPNLRVAYGAGLGGQIDRVVDGQPPPPASMRNRIMLSTSYSSRSTPQMWSEPATCSVTPGGSIT